MSVQKLGLMPDICVEDYLLAYFNTLRIIKKKIHRIDETLASFSNLIVLNLSFNTISLIENIPPNLQELNLTSN